MLKKAAVIGIAGIALGVSPASADSMGDGSMVALTMVGGGGLLSIGCMTLKLLTEDDEVEEEGYDRRGFYIAASASYARENFSKSTVVNLVDGELQHSLRRLRPPSDNTSVYPVTLGKLDEDAFGGMGRGGYRCHPYLSAELQFERLADFNGTILETGMPINDSARRFKLELESLVFTTNVKAHLLTGRYQPFVLMGSGFMRMESKARDLSGGTLAGFAGHASDRRVRLVGRYGAGLDVYLTQGVVMSLEGSYVAPADGKLDGLDYYSFGLGLQYRF